MKIFDANQMRRWDQWTIRHQNVSSLDLMERAAQRCTDWISEQHFTRKNIQVICGTGNNGGDGLAIARQLTEAGYGPTVFITAWDGKESDDFRENKIRLEMLDVKINLLKEENDFTGLQKSALIIDALFGYGLNRPLTGLYSSLVDYINTLEATIISIDIPSGMFMDKSSKGSTILKATHTLTFQSMKLCFLMAENAGQFGEVHVLPIGLSDEYEMETEAKYLFTDITIASSFYKKRKKFSHKGTYGHALLLAGSEEKMGAAVMCTRSCLRSGVGLLTCSLTRDTFSILHNTAPEAMTTTRGQEKELSKYSTIGVGPGLGTDETVSGILSSFISEFRKPMVIDADALNIISKNKNWLEKIPEGSVLTPHPKEFDRIWEESNSDWDRMKKAVDAAQKHQVIIVLKGTYTLVTDGTRNYFNSSGNNGLATGGSGDILTGLLTGLLSQKYEPLEAAVTGVYIHGLAADLCLEEQAYESLLPVDVVEKFGKAFQILQKNKGA